MTQTRVRSFSTCLVCILVLIGFASAEEKETRVKMKDLPPAVQQTVREQSKGAKIRGYSKEVEDGKTFYEVSMTVDGHGKDVLIDPEGVVVEVEEQVALKSLPSRVKDAIVKAAGKGKILIVESITKKGSVEAYEAHVVTGRKKSEIKVGADGQLLPGEQD
ncbi:MAG TPA: hypothetical protein VFV34_15580 [Blastocatellia bacterium]|nr:hypothetical protein [Blastocatellia bacterium]